MDWLSPVLTPSSWLKNRDYHRHGQPQGECEEGGFFFGIVISWCDHVAPRLLLVQQGKSNCRA